MRFITFRRLGETRSRLGLDLDDRASVVDMSLQHPDTDWCTSLEALIAAGERGLDAGWEAFVAPKAAAIVPWSDVVLGPPLRPPAMQDCGVIRTHTQPIRAEMCRWIMANTDDPRSFEELIEWMTVGSDPRRPLSYGDRDHQTVTGPFDIITRPAESRVLDYELELGVVVGKGGHLIERADAADHIFGYTIYNDWSLRDVQTRNILAGRGVHGNAKDFAGSNTIGPCVVTKDEIPDPYGLAMTVRVNGETWGSGSSREAGYTFEDAIVTISHDRPIQAAEVYGSGTVRNGSSFEISRRLPNSAYVELEIERIGVLANYVVSGD